MKIQQKKNDFNNQMEFPKRSNIWLLAIRPKTLAASLSPILIGTAMALKTGFFDLLTFLFTLLTGLGIQIATNLANDYFDYKKGADTSARLGPIRVTQAKLVSESGMIKMLFFTFLTVLASGSFLIWKGGAIFSLLIAAALLFALIYTAGPFPIAYLGLGEVFVLVFFGPVAVAATYFLQVGQFHLQPVIAGLAPGLLSSAILMVNNIRDIDEDQKAHKKTLAVRFGLPFGKNLYLFFSGSCTAPSPYALPSPPPHSTCKFDTSSILIFNSGSFQRPRSTIIQSPSRQDRKTLDGLYPYLLL